MVPQSVGESAVLDKTQHARYSSIGNISVMLAEKKEKKKKYVLCPRAKVMDGRQTHYKVKGCLRCGEARLREPG